MRTLSDQQKRILKEEYPDIHYESDTDVERYFELRQAGRQSDALNLYNSRLKRKYPDEFKRTELLRFYRSRDPRYNLLYQESLAELADRILLRTRKIIELMTREIETVNMNDAYSVIKLAEGLLTIISPDRYEAIAFTERYARYAKNLNIHPVQMQKTAELIRLYVTDTLESVQEFKKDREQKKREHNRREQAKRSQKPVFDLTKIEFTQHDVARILIPQTISRTEDSVIAYCLKYWNLVNDPAFEKTIFLYSRKYRTKHHDIFQALKNGRDHNWKDEEILNAVLATVVTGYYYSISGDAYLQRVWSRYSQNIAPATQVGIAPAALKLGPTDALPFMPATGKKSVPQRKTKTGKTGKQAVSSIKKSAPSKSQVRVPKTMTPFKAQKAARGKEKPAIPSAPSFTANSVADIIRKMTGKTYTVYKELFFKGIRPSIRTVLVSSSASRKSNLFGNRQNEAEEIVYQFLFEHYNDPYQNWKDSESRKKVEGLGYAIPKIEPVIECWIKKTNDLENSARA